MLNTNKFIFKKRKKEKWDVLAFSSWEGTYLPLYTSVDTTNVLVHYGLECRLVKV